jgi:hypothetical protein
MIAQSTSLISAGGSVGASRAAASVRARQRRCAWPGRWEPASDDTAHPRRIPIRLRGYELYKNYAIAVPTKRVT